MGSTPARAARTAFAQVRATDRRAGRWWRSPSAVQPARSCWDAQCGVRRAPILNRPATHAGGRPSQRRRFYVAQLATMKERELKCLYVNFEHVLEYDQVATGGGAAERAATARLVHVSVAHQEPC